MEGIEEKIKKFLSLSSGYGDGYGDGSGSGSGYGYGYGYGDGSGYGDGYGSGDGSGSDITVFNGKKVYQIDGVATIIDYVRGNIAKGHILMSDFTLTPCWIAKDGNCFAHGDSIREAMVAVEEKVLAKSPIEELIARFKNEWPDPEEKIAAIRLWEWHHILTGSCITGRNAFARDHGIDIEKDAFTVREFINLTKDAYGRNAIRQLAEAYSITI